jgi:hypothetical protein
MSSDARPSVLVHATEELLEEYSFGRIYEPQLGRLEEHLLICPQCQSTLTGIDEYTSLMKSGLASFERERQCLPIPPVHQAFSLRFAFPQGSIANLLLAAAFLLAPVGITAVAWRMQSSVATAPAATVKLIALRGGEGDVAHAPSRSPLDLVFDRTDLPPDLSYRAEVVSSSGRQVWSGNVQITEQRLSARVSNPLRAGVYWVRLYSSGGKLLREFGLNIA